MPDPELESAGVESQSASSRAFVAVDRSGSLTRLPNRAPFGWHILGLCWTILIAHFVAVSSIQQGRYEDEIFMGILIILPFVAIPAICIASSWERSYSLTGKPRLLKCWLVFVVVAIIHLFMALPTIMSARE